MRPPKKRIARKNGDRFFDFRVVTAKKGPSRKKRLRLAELLSLRGRRHVSSHGCLQKIAGFSRAIAGPWPDPPPLLRHIQQSA
jgi:hypothetical protein